MLLPLPEGYFQIQKDNDFIPLIELNTPFQPVIFIQPFYLQTKDEKIIIDPGSGIKQNNFPMIHSTLQKNNISPDSISKVLISHLHKDHSCGMMFLKNSNWYSTFKNAEYYIDKNEWEYAFNHPSKYVHLAMLESMYKSNQIKWIEGGGQIGKNILFENSGGHTPFHKIFIIHSEKSTYFYGGDVVPSYSQLIRKFIAKYDYDGKASREKRAEYLSRGKKHRWTFLFFHSENPPFIEISVEKL